MESLLLMNPRTLHRRVRRAKRHAARGPKRLGNLPPALRAYWQRVRGIGRRRSNPRRRKSRARARTVTTTMRSVRRTNPRKRLSMARRTQRRRRAKRYHRMTRGQKSARTRALRRMMFGTNPRRYRVRHHRHRRNPRRAGGFGGFSVRHIGREFVVPMGIGAVGAVAMDYAWQWGSGYLPAQLQGGYIGTATKAASAIALGWLASKAVGKKTAAIATGGALIVIGYQFIHQLIAQTNPTAAIPATTTAATPAVTQQGLNAYMRTPLGWVSPGTPLRGYGRFATAPGPFGGLNAYMKTASPMGPNVGRPGGTVSISGLAHPGSW